MNARPGSGTARSGWPWLALAAGLLLGLSGIGVAAEPATAVEPPSAAERPAIPAELASPRATMETFLKAMREVQEGHSDRIDQALSTLDLSQVNALVHKEKGRDLAWTLLEVINRTRVVDPRRISAREHGRPYVFARYPQGEVRIAPVEGRGWLFSSATLEALPAVLDGLASARSVAPASADTYLPLHLRIRGSLSPILKRRSFILENWQWLGMLVFIAIGVVLDRLASLLLRLGVRYWRTRYARGSYRGVSDAILRPLGLMLMAAAWWAGLNMMGLPGEVLVVLLVSVKLLAGISGVWGAYRLVDLTGAFLAERAARTVSRLDDALVPMVTKTLKVFVTVLGVVFVADNLNVDVTSLLAGLGLGGLAFALAAKDVVGNLFGSITVLLDQTFHVGDWVVVGDVEGSVENIGFRSTRIRTFYNSLVTIPNSQLITASVDNMGDRAYRRLKCTLSLAYDTPPERIEAYCEGVRALVRLHPYMRKDYYHVYFNAFGDSALEVLVYVFWKTPDWGTELRERHRFLMDCLRLAERIGVEFAYPTQTIHWRRAAPSPPAPAEGPFRPGTSTDEARDHGRRQAEEVVRATTGLEAVPPPVDFGAADPVQGRD